MRTREWLVAWGKEPWLEVTWGTSGDPSSLYLTFTWRPRWALIFLYYCAAMEDEARGANVVPAPPQGQGCTGQSFESPWKGRQNRTPGVPGQNKREVPERHLEQERYTSE